MTRRIIKRLELIASSARTGLYFSQLLAQAHLPEQEPCFSHSFFLTLFARCPDLMVLNPQMRLTFGFWSCCGVTSFRHWISPLSDQLSPRSDGVGGIPPPSLLFSASRKRHFPDCQGLVCTLWTIDTLVDLPNPAREGFQMMPATGLTSHEMVRLFPRDLRLRMWSRKFESSRDRMFSLLIQIRRAMGLYLVDHARDHQISHH